MSFALPSGLIADYQFFVDSFNNGNDFPVTCNLIYPPSQVPCTNCITDQISHRSSNVYKTGGPAPFPQGSICPWCAGVGYLVNETKDVLKVRYSEMKPKDWQDLDFQIEKSTRIIEIRAMLSDLPKFERCEYLELPCFNFARFRRFGNMTPYGIQELRYFSGRWKQVT